MVAPPSIASTTRLRKSSEYGFAIHAGLLPVGSLNHIRAGMGIHDSAFSGNALVTAWELAKTCRSTFQVLGFGTMERRRGLSHCPIPLADRDGGTLSTGPYRADRAPEFA